jgi:hypothetical protein
MSDLEMPSPPKGVMDHAGNILGKGMNALGIYGIAQSAVDTAKGHISIPKPKNFYDHLSTLGGLKLSFRRPPMNLKEALIQKLASRKQAQSGVTVDKTDVDFVTKVAERISQDFVKKSEMTKTAFDISQILGEVRDKGPKFIGGLGSAMMPALQVGSMATVGALGLGALYDRINNSMKSSAAYDQMFEEFPELAQAPREQIDKYWGVLQDFAPILTKNPLVAGQFISNMVNYGMKGVDHATANMLLDIQSKSRNAAGLGDTLSMLKDIARPSFESTVSPDQFNEALYNLNNPQMQGGGRHPANLQSTGSSFFNLL